MSPEPREPVEPSPAKRRAFKVICLLGPLLLLICLEMVLRFFDLGGYEPVFKEVETTSRGTLVITEQAGTGGFFFANPGRPGYNDQYAFYHPKDADTVRVILVGGSAIKGFPQTRNFAVSSFLREMLTDCWPGRDVEVINLGTTAVASFPVREVLKQALVYEPDLVVVYSGHNEFYGAYGVASINLAGRTPWMLKLQYRARGLALAQGLNALVHRARGTKTGPLMEVMVAQDYVAPDSRWRGAAANLLYNHVGDMIRLCRDQDTPVLVCTLPTNERDLAPIGTAPPQEALDRAVSRLRGILPDRPAAAIAELPELLQRYPDHAPAHFLLARAFFLAGDHARARAHFIKARDLDPMPWRAPSASQQAVRRAAEEHGAELCDVEAAFRKHSPGEAIGWEFMDDHVHLSLEGQALLARTLVESLTNHVDALRVEAERLAALPDWTAYAERLGDNLYDRYAVAHTLRVLFRIPFMQESNPEALRQFDQAARDCEAQMTPDLLEIARQWQKKEPHAGGKRPISGMIARGLLRRNLVEEAEDMFVVAQRSVPRYTSWHLEYVYFQLACRERLAGPLTPDEREMAAEEIARGNLLLRHGYAASGFTERYVGRMHQLRGEYAEAIPYLAAAREKLYEFDKVAADQALVLSFVQTGDLGRARDLARNGIQHSGVYADLYREILASIPDAP